MISGIAAAAGGAIWSQLSVEDFMQNYFPNYLTTGRNMMADQVLNRKYFEYEMRIERQNQHRDDIRDLMELTVGRMDIYHVVGTLILTFCITWFTDAQILQADVPDWFRTLFLISNFSAVGYLILSVWLAMHASIAAHSVCVRLLTSFVRLSIPSHEELKKLRISFVPKMEEFMSLARHHVGWLRSKMPHKEQPGASSSASAAAAATEQKAAAGSPGDVGVASASAAAGGSLPQQTAPATFSGPGSLPPRSRGKERDTGEDDTQHFERYLEEQKRWLGYDAYARVCMCLGMNQMLQALSYYVVGVLCKTTLGGGITAYFGVKGLAFLLLKLDISDMGEDWVEYLLVLFFMAVPTFAASAGFLLLEHVEWKNEDWLSLCVVPCFVLHGVWILYIALDLDLGSYCRRGARRRAAEIEGDPLPRRIRTVNYLCVCDNKQRRLADKLREEEAQGPVADMKEAREALEAMMQEVAMKEAESPAAAALERESRELQAAKEHLAETLDAGRACGAAAAGRRAKRELELTQQAADRFEVWQQAPKIHAALRALQDEKVRSYMSEEQMQTIERSYQEFLKQCRALDVAIPDPATPSPDGAEQPHVRFNPHEFVDEWGGLPDSVWVNAGDGSVSWDRPEPYQRITSFTTAVAEEAAWSKKAKALSEPSVGRKSSGSEGGALPRRQTSPERWQTSPERFEIATPLREDEERRWSNGEAAVGQSSSADRPLELLPPGAAPDITLPKRIVQRFTLGTAVWWTLAAGIHTVRTIVQCTQKPALLEAVAVDRLGAWQPGRAAFFEVSSLNCNSTHLLLSDRFAHYAAERLPRTGGLGGFVELGEAGAAAELAWLRGASSESKTAPPPVQTPASWRMVATAWEPCAASLNATCNEAWLAGWDGASVVVASARLGTAEGAWRVRPQFRVHPGLGRFVGAAANRSLEAYSDVRALHLSPGGGSLSILLGSRELDIWDLAAGTRLARLRLGADYAAFCHDGEELLLARQAEDGPVLERAQLPWATGLRPRESAEKQSRARRGHFLEAAMESPRIVAV